MATFDLSFDNTFQKELIAPGEKPVQSGCRSEGIHLTWLVLQGGWMHWVFEGSVLRGLSPTNVGQAKQGGLNRSTQKETSPTMVVHTANLTEAEADAVCSVLESISIYWLKYDADGRVEEIPVTVPDGNAQTWDSQKYTNNFSTTLTLPSRKSQRL